MHFVHRQGCILCVDRGAFCAEPGVHSVCRQERALCVGRGAGCGASHVSMLAMSHNREILSVTMYIAMKLFILQHCCSPHASLPTSLQSPILHAFQWTGHTSGQARIHIMSVWLAGDRTSGQAARKGSVHVQTNRVCCCLGARGGGGRWGRECACSFRPGVGTLTPKGRSGRQHACSEVWSWDCPITPTCATH